jgi:hypothetical protein
MRPKFSGARCSSSAPSCSPSSGQQRNGRHGSSASSRSSAPLVRVLRLVSLSAPGALLVVVRVRRIRTSNLRRGCLYRGIGRHRAASPRSSWLSPCRCGARGRSRRSRLTAQRAGPKPGRSAAPAAGHRLSPWLGRLMVSRQETARPLLTPGEVMQLPSDDELVLVSESPSMNSTRWTRTLTMSRSASGSCSVR